MSFWKKKNNTAAQVSIGSQGFSLGDPNEFSESEEVRLIQPANRDKGPANVDLLSAAPVLPLAPTLPVPEKGSISQIPCCLGRGRVLTGKLFFTKPVRIEGSFKGEIFSSSEVVISAESEVEGKVEAHSVTLHGRLSKIQLAVSDVLDVRDGAAVEGKISAKRAKFGNGSVLNGAVRIG